MNDYLSSNVKKEVDKIKIPEDKLDQAIEYAIKRGKKKQRNLGKKFIYFSSTAVLLFSLIIGSAFVSPAMAKVVSKIPYLGQIFESKSVVMIISDELHENGYKFVGAGVSYPEKEITIGIKGSEKHFDNVKGDIENIAKDILKSRDYDAYTVKVTRYREHVDVPHSEEDKKQMEEQEKRNKMDNEILLALDKAREKYNLLGTGIDSLKKIVEVEIPDTEKRTDEIESYVQNIIQLKTNDQFTIKFKKVNMKKREQDRRWMEILHVVSEDLLGKKDYKVRMVGYSVHPEPEIQMFITLSSSNKNTKAFAQQLEKIIDDFLQSEKMKSRVKNDPYHITIYSKEDKIIN
jgi:Protein of unknown function (DUF4030)